MFRIGKRIQFYIKVYPFIRTQKFLFFALCGFKVFFLLLSLVTPMFYMLLINEVMIAKKIHFLFWIILGHISIYMFQSLGIVLNKITYNKFFKKLNLKLKLIILTKLSKIDFKNYNKYNLGDLKSRVENDSLFLEKFLYTHCLSFLYAIVSVVIIIIILIYMNWILALFGLTMIPFSFLFANFMGKKSQKTYKDYREKFGYYEGFLHSTIQNWKEIKANNLQEKLSENFVNQWYILSKLFIKTQFFLYINRTFIAFKDFFIVRMNLYFIGGLLIINNKMSVGLLLAFMSYYDQLFGHVSSITESILGLNNDTPILKKVFEIIDYPLQEKEQISLQNNNVSVSSVCFRYSESQQLVLKNINLTLKNKEHVAIVGRSGCGKSTLAKVIMGMYEPESGGIFVGGYNINKIGTENIGKYISVVMQEPVLFNLTIRENLLIAKRNASNKELENVCQLASILEFINSLPEKYETIIGERGIKLSGGQKQRFAIARAMLLNAEIIIFDESTSSLDSINEKAIIKSIKMLAKQKTIISIAHRLSSILDVDHVIIMDKGEIVANGKHKELKGKNAIYDVLFQAQYTMEEE